MIEIAAPIAAPVAPSEGANPIYDQGRLDDCFAALSHPLRRQMLAELAAAPKMITELAAPEKMTFAAVSKHLRVLENAGLATRSIAGRSHIFTAVPGALAEAVTYMQEQETLWSRRLDTLKDLMENEMNAANPLVANATVLIGAPREKVFDAWTDPAIASKFLGAGKSHVKDIALDARPGGELMVNMSDGDEQNLHRGEFLAIDRPNRLVFSWISQHTALRLTIVSVDFASEAGGTRVTLRQEGFLTQKAANGHQGGWASILEKLAGLTFD